MDDRDVSAADGSGLPPAPPELEPPGRGAPTPAGERFADVTALLQNRFILLGLGVIVVLLLLTLVLVVVGDSGSDDKGSPAVSANTPQPQETVAPLVGLPGTLLSTATMRNGPATGYAILGTIPRGALVPVVGRNEDASWLQVVYPPNSQLRGWVDAALLSVDGSLDTLVIAGPGAGPQVPLPTSFPFITPVIVEEPTVEAEPTVVEEPTAEERRATRTPRPTSTTQVVPTRTSVATPQATPAGE